MIILTDWSDMNTWTTLFSLIGACVALIAGLIPVSIKLFKTLKELVKNKDWNKIKEIAQKAIEAAEASGKSGEDKKAQVIAAVKAGCSDAGIELTDALLSQLSSFIDSTIDFVNQMNKAKTTDNK